MDSDGAEWDSEGPQQTVGGFSSCVGFPVSLSSVPDDTILLLVSPTASQSKVTTKTEAIVVSVPRITFITVKGIGSQAQGSGADAAPEALAVEKVTLGTQPLHHKHALLTEVAGVTAAQAQGKCLSHRFLGPGEKSCVRAEYDFKGHA